jgi:hypothetical protein
MSERDEFATFIDVGTSPTKDYVLLGEGISSAQIDYNPQTTTETYINQRSGTTTVDSYQPVMSVDAKHIETDEALDFLDTLRKTRPVGDDAKKHIVNVWLYETPVLGEYPAEEQEVNIQFDSFGGAGGAKNAMSCKLNYVGDPVQGTFNPTTSTFTAASE